MATENDLRSYLRSAREAAGLTQKETAARSGLDKTLISHLETGKKRIRSHHLLRLAGAYKVDRHFVLLFAGIMELSGFDILMREAERGPALDALLIGATLPEKRQLAMYLASLRMRSQMKEDLFDDGNTA